MNAKDLKFMLLFERFVKTDFLVDRKILTKSMKGFLDLDYQAAVGVWDFLTTTREDELINDKRIAQTLGEMMLQIFYERAPSKCTRAVTDTPAVRRAVFQHSPDACAPESPSFLILTDLLAANKTAAGEEILRCVIKNDRIHYGDSMRRCIERVFIELLKKNPAKIDMNKKLNLLLTAYVKRIRTDERAMLEQRLKEIT
ncbi:MAG: hypothetical protein LBP26_07755 [Clostridiales bacterium]|nr:hypothetical protein [Clostridiales bacterium]